jgi:DHA1 family bicyclomycin/chloramphenicol resistance-like MFS transporter
MPGRTFALALGFTALITPLAVHLFMPVIPAVKAALGLTDAQAQLTFSISLFGMAFANLFYGTMSDRYGRRPVLMSGFALFMLGSALSAVAQTTTLLVLGRLVQAVGAGCGVTLTRAIARDAYHPQYLVKVIAYLTMFGTLGPMIAPVIGGILTDIFGWRSVFGFALLAGGAITVAGAVSVYETHPLANRATGAESAARGYAVLFSRLRFNAFVFVSGLMTAAFMVIASASASLMTELLHRPVTEFGFYFPMIPIGFFIGSLVSSRVGNRVAGETMILLGSVLALVSVSAQAIALSQGLLVPLTFFIPGAFVTMAQGISMPYAQVGAMTEVPRYAGAAAGVGVFMQNFCAAVFAQLYGLLADGTARPMTELAMVIGLLILVVGAIPYLLRRRAAVVPAAE